MRQSREDGRDSSAEEILWGGPEEALAKHLDEVLALGETDHSRHGSGVRQIVGERCQDE